MRRALCLVMFVVMVFVGVHPVRAADDPDAEKDFRDKAAASSQRASDMLPFLSDHPELLHDLRRRILGQRSLMDGAVNPAPAVAQQRIISISPSNPGPVNEIDTIQGYPTTVSFIDVTGARWPIHWEVKTAVYGNSSRAGEPVASNADHRSSEERQQADDTFVQEATQIAAVTIGHGFQYSVPVHGRNGNTINVVTESPSPRGGMNIMLEGAKSSIPLQLRAAGPQGGGYDAQVTIRVLARGPEARASIAVRDEIPVTGGHEMMDMLEGHAPAQAVPLDIRGLSPDRVRAWKLGSHYFIRTDVTILSPQPLNSAAGENASIYQITPTPVVSVSDNGNTRLIYLDDR